MGAHRSCGSAGEGGEGLSVSATLFEGPTAEQVAKVAVDVPLAHLDRLFDYRIPGKLLEDARPGVRVSVPFAGQVVDGWLVSIGRPRNQRETRRSAFSYLPRTDSDSGAF